MLVHGYWLYAMEKRNSCISILLLFVMQKTERWLLVVNCTSLSFCLNAWAHHALFEWPWQNEFSNNTIPNIHATQPNLLCTYTYTRVVVFLPISISISNYFAQMLDDFSCINLQLIFNSYSNKLIIFFGKIGLTFGETYKKYVVIVKS